MTSAVLLDHAIGAAKDVLPPFFAELHAGGRTVAMRLGGVLWPYTFRVGAIARVFAPLPRTELVFGSPWTRPKHLLSLLAHREGIA